MLKQTIEYSDFDDNLRRETLYFNLTKSELADNLHLREEFESLHNRFKDGERNLETNEIKLILDLVKELMRLSYGIRTEDGRRFIKNDEIWTEFTQTAAYDAFLFSLFEEPEKAMLFMTGILPKDMRDAAVEAARENIQAVGLTPPAPREQPQKPNPYYGDGNVVRPGVEPQVQQNVHGAGTL